MTIEAVIFDLDDTLYLERDYAWSGFRTVAEKYADILGDPTTSQDAMRRLFESPQRGRVFNEILSQKGTAEENDMVARMVQTFRNHTPDIRLLPDADAALSRLSPAHKLGIITDGPAAVQRRKIGALNLEQRVDKIIVTDELGHQMGKPDPKSFRIITDAFGVEPSRCAYVGDNAAKDFVAPNQLQWVTVQVVRDRGVYRDVPPATGGEPRHKIRSLAELDSILKK